MSQNQRNPRAEADNPNHKMKESQPKKIVNQSKKSEATLMNEGKLK
jgi:hypothetical protein